MFIVKLSMTLSLFYALMIQPSSLKICTCNDMYTFSDSSFASTGASYQVGAGEGCCSGTPVGSGHFGEVYYDSSGNLEFIDYCETSGAAAQAYCC
jgi:hypothetical protein